MLTALRVFILFIILVLAAAGSGGCWFYVYRLQEPLPLINDWHYSVSPKTNLSQVAIDLINKELLSYPAALTWVTLARLQGRAHQIKAGDYTIPLKTTPQEFLDILIKGKTSQQSFTIPEGWNFRQLIAALRNSEQLVHTLDELDDDAIMAKLGLPNQHPEGLFYPDTYYLSKNTTDLALLRRAYETMQVELKTAWAKRSSNLPLKSPYEALILASIVEKETGKAPERPLIAGVFVRRLKIGMRLQTDPTVIYALGTAFDGNIHKEDLNIDSPYNTYRNKGLPPTPIALPGREALLAAVKPSEDNSLYFVAKGDGTHYFSSTLSEHECAVFEYQLKTKAPERYKKVPKSCSDILSQSRQNQVSLGNI